MSPVLGNDVRGLGVKLMLYLLLFVNEVETNCLLDPCLERGRA